MAKIWIQLDGRQQGPFSLDELRGMNILPDTPVWYEGLPQWTFAAAAPLTATLFSSANAGFQPREAYGAASWTANPQASASDVVCPPTYLVWAILVTLCCCIPFGIVAIFYATQVTSRFVNHDYEGARKASDRAQLWIILALVAGLISAPFSLIFALL